MQILIKLPAVDLDGDRALDNGIDEHHRAERAGLDGQAFGSQCLDDLQVQALRVLGIGSSFERRPSSTTNIAEERELRDHQDRATDVVHR